MAWGRTTRKKTRSAYAFDSRGRKKRRKKRSTHSKKHLKVHVKVEHHY